MNGIVCTKCKGKNIEIKEITEEPKETKIKPRTMNDWAIEQSTATATLEIRYTHEIATCKDCGYKVERYI